MLTKNIKIGDYMNLKDRMESLRNAGSNTPRVSPGNDSEAAPLPMYGVDGRPIKSKHKQSRAKLKKRILIIAPIATLMLLIVSIVYLPQFFMHDKPEGYLFTPDKSAVQNRAQYVIDSGTVDFDGDGMINSHENAKGTDPYNHDTDGDGVADGVDRNPLDSDPDILYNAKITAGIGLKKPYKVDGVILWAQNDESLAHGSVVKTKNGYQFTNFEGWAKFPDGEYAYMYKNGIHSLMDKRADGSAWIIPGDCNVVLMDELQSETNIFSFFGIQCKISNSFGGFLSAILPDNGWITCTRMLNDDWGATDEVAIELNHASLSYSLDNPARFGQITNSLQSLADVYLAIDSGKVVFASLFDASDGEMIVEVYGYTEHGNLLVANVQKTNQTSILAVTPRSKQFKDAEQNIISHQYFEFSGCGFNSSSGDTIAFFSTAVSSFKIDSGANDVPQEPRGPENGTLQVGNETHYYINHTVVTETFIRFYNGKYEVCNPLAEGAFYVGKDRTLQKGLVHVGQYTYIYANGKFMRDQFVSVEEDGSFAETDNADAPITYCVNAAGYIIKGWFTYNQIWFYADMDDGIIQKSLIVEYTDKTNRFLNAEGKCATNCYVKELEENRWEQCDLSDEGAIYLSQNGAPATGWYKLEDVTYYGDPETGIVQKNVSAIFSDGTKRYLSADGSWISSCYVKEIEDRKWVTCTVSTEGAIRLSADGAPIVGWYVLNGVDYYGDKTGVVQKSVVVPFNTTKRYVDSNGNWVKSCYVRELKDNRWESCTLADEGAIWLNSDGTPATGWYTQAGKTYYGNTAGVVQKGVYIPYTDGKRRYLNDKGIWVKSCCVKENSDGTWSTCAISDNGAILLNTNGVATTGWFTKDGATYYASVQSGVIQQACFMNDKTGKPCYLGNNGQLVRYGSVTLDGITISFNAKGQCVTQSTEDNNVDSIIKKYYGQE